MLPAVLWFAFMVVHVCGSVTNRNSRFMFYMSPDLLGVHT